MGLRREEKYDFAVDSVVEWPELFRHESFSELGRR